MNSVRDLHSDTEHMERYMADMRRITDAALIQCGHKAHGEWCEGNIPGCPFRGVMDDKYAVCNLACIQMIVGDVP